MIGEQTISRRLPILYYVLSNTEQLALGLLLVVIVSRRNEVHIVVVSLYLNKTLQYLYQL